MPGDVEHVVDAADDPEIAVLVAARAVAGEVDARDFAPVGLAVARGVAVDRAQHGGPGAADDQLAAHVGPDLAPVVIDHGRIDAEERQRGRAGLHRRGARHGRDHVRARLGLPPGVDDRAALAADLLVIPHPRLGIDRLAHAAEQAQRGEIVRRQPVVAPLDEGADRRRRGVEDVHLVLVDQPPEAVRLREVRRALVDEARAAVAQNAVGHVAVPGDPAHVRGAEVDVLRPEVEVVLRRGVAAEQVARRGVQDALRLARAAAGVEDEKRMLAVEHGGRADGADRLRLLVQPESRPGRHGVSCFGAAGRRGRSSPSGSRAAPGRRSS